MSNIDFRDLKERISDEKLIDILSKYDVKPVVNADKYIIFPTCCHNLTGGSPKLYYYKNSKLFKCYTQCGDSFDIFELIIRMEKLRGKDITIYDAIKKCEVSLNSFYERKEDLKDDIDFCEFYEAHITDDIITNCFLDLIESNPIKYRNIKFGE